jgi:ABC-type Fe3+-siderophore transport system permease subunit
MNFDLRFPIGILFGFYGVLLTIYGLVGDKEQYARSLGININLIWGIVMLVFGAFMLALAILGKSKQSDDDRK